MTSLSLRATQTASVPVAEYERVGAEYYDPELHPTCANFRSASEQIVARWLGATSGQVVEVGCGRSVVAELLRGQRSNLRALTLLDSSWTMLRHSLPFVESGAMLVLSEADELALRDGVADLLVASLGDPYNSEAFWRASRRVVRTDGRIIFSTPSFEWSTAFRRSMHHPPDVAEFVRLCWIWWDT
jgi:ubiquinone/menaquinone biosynthesis C-methylase UbiE